MSDIVKSNASSSKLETKQDLTKDFLSAGAIPHTFTGVSRIQISDQFSYKKEPSKVKQYVKRRTFSFPGGGNCPCAPPPPPPPQCTALFSGGGGFLWVIRIGVSDLRSLGALRQRNR